MTTSWTSPSRPIPRTLPTSRSRASTVESTTSTTRLCFSSTTPVRTHVPNVKIAMNRRITPTLAKRNEVSRFGSDGSSSRSVDGLDAPRRSPDRSRRRSDLARRRSRPRRSHDLGERAVVALLDDELRGAVRLGRDDEQPVERALAEARLAGRDVRQRLDVDVQAGPARRSPSGPARSRPAASRRSPAAGPGRSPPRSFGRKIPATRIDDRQDERDEERPAPAALEDLAPGNEPDRASRGS